MYRLPSFMILSEGEEAPVTVTNLNKTRPKLALFYSQGVDLYRDTE